MASFGRECGSFTDVFWTGNGQTSVTVAEPEISCINEILEIFFLIKLKILKKNDSEYLILNT